tara:strand:- start:1647 stop:2246 length:600 start_codon:yes stop_codon:yes gene_type:complete
MLQVSADYMEVMARKKERMVSLRHCLEQDLDGVQSIFFEAGCGHGHWLTNYASLHPETVCVGIDLINKRIRKCHDKSELSELNNCFFYQAELLEFLEALPKSIHFSAVLMLFPDPWPKARHHRRRMVKKEFLDQLAMRVSEKGRFYFRTDDLPYYEWACEKLQQHPKWSIDTELDWPHETVTYFQNLMDAYYSLQASRL